MLDDMELDAKDLKEILSYAFGGNVPGGFLDHLIRRRKQWDEEFTKRLNDLAYEIRPDLITWELSVNDKGYLIEKRMPLISAGHRA